MALKAPNLALMVFAAIALSACHPPGERALGGAAIGGLAGASIGGIASGHGGGVITGAAIGVAAGGIAGAATASPEEPVLMDPPMTASSPSQPRVSTSPAAPPRSTPNCRYGTWELNGRDMGCKP